MTQNKNSFFQVTLNTSQIQNNQYQLDGLDNSMDLVLSSMKVNNLWYKFQQIHKEQIIYLFKSEDRKRQGQLDRYCQRFLSKEQPYQAKSHSKLTFQLIIDTLKKNKNFTQNHKPELFSDYQAKDILIFDDPKKWHPWQKQIYHLIFDETNNFKTPDQRKIISLVDKKGNSGKSSFFKWLFYNNPTSIGRIGYGSASQLRSSVVNLGKKKLYIVDLARAKSKNDHQEDLLSVLEDLKTGLVTNAMYGSGKTLIMEPPHIIVSSNYVLDYSLLSEDRWQVYQIASNNKLNSLDPKKLKDNKPPVKKS